VPHWNIIPFFISADLQPFKIIGAGRQWLTPVILAEIRRQRSGRANSSRGPISKNPSQKGTGGVAQGESP
jgi:hypothetical protein